MPEKRLSRAAIFLAILLGFFCIPVYERPVDASDAVEKLAALIDEMESSYSKVNDYSGLFLKQEKIQAEMQAEQTARFKFLKPFKVYMEFITGPSRGTEILYVKGDYDNKMLVHKGGILGFITLSLDPRSSLAMSRSRHPITEFGFGFLLDQFRRNFEPAARFGDVEIERLADEQFQGRPSTAIVGRFLPRGGRKYYCSRFVIHMDKELKLPVENVFYDEKDEMFERYVLTDVKLNAGLTSSDFSRRNKAYRF